MSQTQVTAESLHPEARKALEGVAPEGMGIGDILKYAKYLGVLKQIVDVATGSADHFDVPVKGAKIAGKVWDLDVNGRARVPKP